MKGCNLKSQKILKKLKKLEEQLRLHEDDEPVELWFEWGNGTRFGHLKTTRRELEQNKRKYYR